MGRTIGPAAAPGVADERLQIEMVHSGVEGLHLAVHVDLSRSLENGVAIVIGFAEGDLHLSHLGEPCRFVRSQFG